MSCRPVTWWSGILILTLVVAIALAPGCNVPTRRTVPFDPPNAKPLLPADEPSSVGPVIQAGATSYTPGGSGMRRPRNILALSGGGAYGAFSAGFVAGWTQSGTRPEFDVVTGISTGALIAPLAFLGPEYDCRLGRLYTQVQAADIFKVRAWVTIPFTDAVALSSPLKKLIEQEITPELMERIAAEHRKGRRLYVGTTNLDTRRLVVWDLGAIACKPCPEGCLLFRDVLLASCAVPGMLPPVQFEVEVDGQKATELHIDGGITAQVFVPSHVFAAAAAPENATPAASRTGAGADPAVIQAGGPGRESGTLYVVVAGKLYPDAHPVTPRVLPVLGATTRAILYAHCRADLANLYGLSRAAGLRYSLAALRQEFPPLETSVDFDPKAMTNLFEEGVQRGTNGPQWMSGPPTLTPGDGDYIRTGLKMKSPRLPALPGN